MIHSVNVALEIARIAFKKTCNIIAVIHFGNYIKSTSYHFVKPALSKGLLAQAYILAPPTGLYECLALNSCFVSCSEVS